MNGENVEVFKNVVTNYFKTLSYSSPTKIEKKKKLQLIVYQDPNHILPKFKPRQLSPLQHIW
jgi:hypothetical protein